MTRPWAEVIQDARNFLMIYGDGSPKAKSLYAALSAEARSQRAEILALHDLLAYLRTRYASVAGTALTGADGLDMDEAYAAQLYRDIVAFPGFQKK